MQYGIIGAPVQSPISLILGRLNPNRQLRSDIVRISEKGSASQMSSKRRTAIKVIIAGDANCGKTSILQRLLFNKFLDGYRATIGCDFYTRLWETKGEGPLFKYFQQRAISRKWSAFSLEFANCLQVLIADKVVQCQLWDTAGQERHRAMSAAFYRGSDVCVLVYDTQEPKSLRNIDSWRDEFLAHATLPSGQKPIVVILGNKAEEGTPKLCEYSGSELHFFVSAKTGLNVEQAFDALCQKCVEMEDNFPHDEFNKHKIDIAAPPIKKDGNGVCC